MIIDPNELLPVEKTSNSSSETVKGNLLAKKKTGGQDILPSLSSVGWELSVVFKALVGLNLFQGPPLHSFSQLLYYQSGGYMSQYLCKDDVGRFLLRLCLTRGTATAVASSAGRCINVVGRATISMDTHFPLVFHLFIDFLASCRFLSKQTTLAAC